jgi:RND family efflux transporter MFP subunit
VQLGLRDSEGAQALKDAFVLAQEQLAGLRKRGAALRAAAQPAGPARHAVVAPISGEIVRVHHVLGEQVEGQGALFRLQDLSRVWIAAHVSEFDLAAIGPAPGALLRIASHPEQSFDVLGDLDGRVVHVGKIVDPETRSVVLRYEAANPDGLLRAGMFADVLIETDQAALAVAVPKQAIVMDNGIPVAFVLLHGEAFQKRVLELGIQDGDFVEVRSGIREGERVVTKGAYLVRLASASPASFGEGHAH